MLDVNYCCQICLCQNDIHGQYRVNEIEVIYREETYNRITNLGTNKNDRSSADWLYLCIIFTK